MTAKKGELVPAGELLVPTDGPAALALAHALGARFDAVSLTIEDPDIPFEHWRDMGRAIGFVGNTWQWWLGDWFNLGEELFGDDASAAVDDVAARYEVASRVTGNATGSLQNIKSIAKRIPRENRKVEYSIWTHALVAKLPAKEQAKWLNRAVKKRWKRDDLKLALAGTDPNEPGVGLDPGAEDPDDPANARVSVEDRLRLIGKNLLAVAQENGDGTFTVPAEQIAQLRAVLDDE